jgi:hypothetical protein
MIEQIYVISVKNSKEYYPDMYYKKIEGAIEQYKNTCKNLNLECNEDNITSKDRINMFSWDIDTNLEVQLYSSPIF